MDDYKQSISSYPRQNQIHTPVKNRFTNLKQTFLCETDSQKKKEEKNFWIGTRFEPTLKQILKKMLIGSGFEPEIENDPKKK